MYYICELVNKQPESSIQLKNLLKREDSELQREGQEPSSFHTFPAVNSNYGESKELFAPPAFLHSTIPCPNSR